MYGYFKTDSLNVWDPFNSNHSWCMDTFWKTGILVFMGWHGMIGFQRHLGQNLRRTHWHHFQQWCLNVLYEIEYAPCPYFGLWIQFIVPVCGWYFGVVHYCGSHVAVATYRGKTSRHCLLQPIWGYGVGDAKGRNRDWTDTIPWGKLR